MAILKLDTSDQFVNNESVTSGELNNLTLNAKFVTGASGATDNARCEIDDQGRITVAPNGIRKEEVDFINATTGAFTLAGSTPKIVFDDTANTSGNNPVINADNPQGSLLIATNNTDALVTIKAANSSNTQIERLSCGEGVAKNENNESRAGVKVTGFLHATQAITSNGDIVAEVDSDERLKDNIEPIKDALGKLQTLSGNTFTWNDKSEKVGISDIGVIAQEVEKVIPMAVRPKDSGYLRVQYSKIIPLLVQSIKELSEKVEKLESMAHTHGIK